MCLFKKLKILKPSTKPKSRKEGKSKRIKKNFKLRRREARRRRRARKRLNKMKKLQFDEKTLVNLKNSVLQVLESSNFEKQNLQKPKFQAQENHKKIISIGLIREIRGPLLGKRSDSVKSVETTDEESENDGFRGKNGSGGKSKGGCCSWPSKGGLHSKYLNNLNLYDICPVEDGSPSQVRQSGRNHLFGFNSRNKNYKDTSGLQRGDQVKIKKEISAEEGIITFNRKYAEEKKGKFIKKMKNISSFVFECNLSHRFVLSNKQVVNGKWCKSCSKAVEKLRKKVSKEGFKVLNFESSSEFAEKVRDILQVQISQNQGDIEKMMIQEEVEREVRERRSLESRFQRWTKVTSTMTTTESRKPGFFLYKLTSRNAGCRKTSQ